MKNHKIRAICFDMGETLICYEGTSLNWKENYVNALHEVCAAFGEKFSKDAESKAIQTLLKFNTRETPRLKEVDHEEIFGAIGMNLGLQNHLPSDICKPFFRYFQRRATPYPEVTEVLTTLKGASFATGVLTDVPYGMPRELVLEDLHDLLPHLDKVVTSVEAGYRKPHSAGFLMLAEALGITPGDMIYMGNEKKDIEGALSAGAVAVLIDRNGKHPDWHQNHTLNTMLELRDVLT